MSILFEIRIIFLQFFSRKVSEFYLALYLLFPDDKSLNFDDTQWEIHVLTGALKLFFRELHETLFSAKHFEKFKLLVNSGTVVIW